MTAWWRLLFVLCLLSGAAAAAGPEKWGQGPIAEERPRYEALVADLEKQARMQELRETQIGNDIEAVWGDWPGDDRVEAIEWFERSDHAPPSARGLDWATQEWKAAQGSYVQIMTTLRQVDPYEDTDIGKAARDQLWSLHLTTLRREIDYRNAKIIHDGIKLQALKAYPATAMSELLGMSTDEFVNDTLDDMQYVLYAHADRFWNDLLYCAAKVVARDTKDALLKLKFPEAREAPAVPGVPEPAGARVWVEGRAYECITDAVKGALVGALTAALRKQFVDDVEERGVHRDVAEYWWTHYILADQAEEGPRAARTRSFGTAVRDRIAAVLEEVTGRKDKVKALLFGLDQFKEELTTQLDLKAKQRLRETAKGVVWEAYKQVRAEGVSADRPQRLRKMAAVRMRTTGKELFEKDTALWFIEALDYFEVLLNQGYTAWTVFTAEAEFDKHAKVLIDEYHEINRCLVKLKMATGPHAVIAVYKYSAEIYDEFFKSCAEARETEDLSAAIQMREQMRGLLGQAQAQAAALAEACEAGKAKIESAKILLSGQVAAIKAMRDSVAGLGTSGMQLESIVERARGGSSGASRGAEAAATAKQATEKHTLEACDRTEAVRRSTDAAVQRNLLDAVVAAEAAASQQAAEASKGLAAAQAAALIAAEAAAAADPLIDALRSLEVRVAGPDFDPAAVGALAAEAEAAAQAAETASAALERAHRLAKILVNNARQTLGGRTQSAEARAMLVEIEGLFAPIPGLKAGDTGCARRLRAAVTSLRAALDDAEQLAKTTLAEANAALAELATKDPGAARLASDEAKAAADVAEVFAAVAQESAGDAAACLKIAQAAHVDREAEIAAAAEAALRICDFATAKPLIDRLPAGPRQTALIDAYIAAFTREAKTDALFTEAKQRNAAGDYEGALSSLDAALANSQCEAYRTKIADAIGRVTARLVEALAEKARAAIAQCDFAGADGLIGQLEARQPARAVELRTEYAVAYEREQRTNALWEEARGFMRSGSSAEVLDRLRAALANTSCNAYRDRINAAIARIESRGQDAETQTATTQEGQETEREDQADAAGRWRGPWQGTLRLSRLAIDGSPMTPPQLLADIDRRWREYVERRQRDQSLGGAIFGDMEREIGEKVVGIVKSGVALLQYDLPVSFLLEAEGDGYRVVLPDMPPARDGEPPLLALVRQLPRLQPQGDGTLSASRAMENAAGTVETLRIASADAAAGALDLEFSIVLQADPSSAGNQMGLSSFVLGLAGRMTPGSVGYAELESRYGRLVAAPAP